MENQITITVSGILADLANGMTRTTSDKNYDSERGSIQDKYNLNGVEVKELFDHPQLKGKKTILPKTRSFILVDDISAVAESVTSEIEVSTVEQEEVQEETQSSADVVIEDTDNEVVVEQPTPEPVTEGSGNW